MKSVRIAHLAAAALLLLTPLALRAQAAPTAVGPSPSRVDLTGQYGYFHPFNSDINNYQYPSVPFGFVGSIAGYYNQYIGLQLEGSAFPQGPADNNCVYTAQAGPILRYQKGRFVPFMHALGGAAKVGGPALQLCNVWGWGVTGGFGLDYILPVLHNRLAVRAAQGDFQYAQIDNGPLVLPTGIFGGFGEIWSWRASAGLTLRFGSLGGPHGDTTMTCSTDPVNALPGDPITVTSMVDNLRPYKDVEYLWTTTGGKIANSEATTTIDTKGLEAGTYNVTGRLVRSGSMKELASCATAFTLGAPAPPPPPPPPPAVLALVCTPDHAAINSGDPVVITSTASGAAGRPLTYTYQASEGQLTPNGNTAAITTAGLTPGTITVTCNVADDQSHTATSIATVNIATPPMPAAAPASSPLCTLAFDRDRRRPDRVDNAAKACLDDIALTLNRDPAAKIVLIGNHGVGETNRNAAERALNASDYLTREKSIDAARIQLRIADDRSRAVTTLLLPSGAATDTIPGNSFDTSTVARRGQEYPGTTPTPRTHRKRRHPKTPPAPIQ